MLLSKRVIFLTMQTSTPKRIPWGWLVGGVFAGLAVIAALALFSRLVAPPVSWKGLVLDSPNRAADFTLTNAQGQATQLSDFRGQVVLLFFGFTFCPDVCPISLSQMSSAYKMLTPAEAERVRVLFISVDPERDTPQKTQAYASAYHPAFIGLTGTPEQVAEAATPFGIFYEKVPGSSPETYTVNHTATITVVDAEGYVRLFWTFGTPPEDIVSDLRNLLR